MINCIGTFLTMSLYVCLGQKTGICVERCWGTAKIGTDWRGALFEKGIRNAISGQEGMVLSSWSNGSNSCRIPGGVMERAKLCFCLGSGGRLQGPQAQGREQQQQWRTRGLGVFRSQVGQSQEEGDREELFLTALTWGLLRDVLEDHSGHSSNYFSCKLFSHLALTALSRAWLSR